MRIHNEEELLRTVAEDRWMMDILAAARTLELPDCWVCAGFVRSKVWDVQHGFTGRTPLGDVDVIYYDPDDIREEVEKGWEARLRESLPSVPWSVKNLRQECMSLTVWSLIHPPRTACPSSPKQLRRWGLLWMNTENSGYLLRMGSPMCWS